MQGASGGVEIRAVGDLKEVYSFRQSGFPDEDMGTSVIEQGLEEKITFLFIDLLCNSKGRWNIIDGKCFDWFVVRRVEFKSFGLELFLR